MTSSSPQIERITGQRVCIRLHGVVSRSQVEALRTRCDEVLADLPRGGEVLLDLTDVTECDIQSCRGLALIQRKVGSQGLRTAYLTCRPRIHGVAWWIVHASGDQHAMPVITMDFAESWLASEAERTDELQARSAHAVRQARLEYLEQER